MNEPRYAAHERMILRGKSLSEGSPDHLTFSLYEQLGQHLIRAYPESGPLRSVSLRKLAESLNDILDHAELTHLRTIAERLPVRRIVQTSGAPAELSVPASPAPPVPDETDEGISGG
jgi:hypothetical protein